MAGPHNIFDAHAAPQLGERATESTYRKIELQSPADLTYLIANVNQAAREKLDKHLPPAAGEASSNAEATGEQVQRQAQLRRQTEEHVDAYIRATFHAAKDSLAINGLDARELDAELARAQADGEGELEPFDARLAQRVQQLSAQIEAQTLKMAGLRRKGPQQTARRYIETFERQARADEARLEAQRAAGLEAARATSIAVADAEGPARAEEVERTYRAGVDALAKLQAEMGGTVAKMERAQKAAEVMAEEEQRAPK